MKTVIMYRTYASSVEIDDELFSEMAAILSANALS